MTLSLCGIQSVKKFQNIFLNNKNFQGSNPTILSHNSYKNALKFVTIKIYHPSSANFNI